MHLKKHFTILAILSAITAAVYFPAMRGVFLDWDDQEQVIMNPDVQTLSIKTAHQVFTHFYTGMYQPLASLSYAIEYNLVGANTWLYHVDNLCLHLLNIILVYFLSRRLFDKKTALAASAAFALWPGQVEAVAWISARSTLLSTAFSLSAILIYCRHLKTPDKKNWIWILTLYLLACLTKASAVVLPALLLAIDWLEKKNLKKSLLEKTIFLPIILGTFLIAVAARRSVGTTTFSIYNTLDRIALVAYTAAWQFLKALWPFGNNTYYEHPTDNNDHLLWWVYLTALLPLLIWLKIILQKNRRLIFGFLWFSVAILPSIQLAPYITIAGADRYNYLGGLGLWWLIILGAQKLITKYKINKKYWLSLAIIIIAALSLESWQLAQSWTDSLNLWDRVVKTQPTCASAYLNRGQALQKEGRSSEAFADIDYAIALNPSMSEAWNTRGSIMLSSLNKYTIALDNFNRAIYYKDTDPVYFYNRGLALMNLGKAKEAFADYNHSWQMASNDLKYQDLREHLLYSQGVGKLAAENPQEAIDYLNKAITLNNKYGEAYYYRGIAKKIIKSPDFCADLETAANLGSEMAQKDFAKFCSNN